MATAVVSLPVPAVVGTTAHHTASGHKDAVWQLLLFYAMSPNKEGTTLTIHAVVVTESLTEFPQLLPMHISYDI